jgi:hypothetical protein
MNDLTRANDGADDGPTAADLAAIEVEMPLIEAEIELLGAEIRAMTAYPEPTALDWKRMRRAEALVCDELVKLFTRFAPAAGSAGSARSIPSVRPAARRAA